MLHGGCTHGPCTHSAPRRWPGGGPVAQKSPPAGRKVENPGDPRAPKYLHGGPRTAMERCQMLFFGPREAAPGRGQRGTRHPHPPLFSFLCEACLSTALSNRGCSSRAVLELLELQPGKTTSHTWSENWCFWTTFLGTGWGDAPVHANEKSPSTEFSSGPNERLGDPNGAFPSSSLAAGF